MKSQIMYILKTNVYSVLLKVFFVCIYIYIYIFEFVPIHLMKNLNSADFMTCLSCNHQSKCSRRLCKIDQRFGN